MRSTGLALIATLLSTVAAAATFEARSERYALSVTATDEGAMVRLTELDTGSTLISQEVLWKPGQPAEIIRDMGTLHISLRLMRGAQILDANLEVDREEMELDRIHAEWSLAPRRAHV